MSTYIIIGGHGKVALLTAPLLTAKGDSVHSIIRNADQSADIEALGAQAVVLDMQSANEAQMTQAFKGADAIIWSAGAGGGTPERTYAIDRDAAIRSMNAAVQAHVNRYVMVSYWGAGYDLDRLDHNDSFYPYAQAKADADAFLRSTELHWTILAPTMLTLEHPSGHITLGSPTEALQKYPSTSRANVAEVIAAVLADDATIGRTLAFHDGATTIADAIRS